MHQSPNKLIKLSVLRLSKHGERGEKYFSLNLEDDEELISSDLNLKKRIVISKPSLPTMPIEGYEQKAIVKKYEPATWIDRLNSVIIRSEKIDSIKELDNLLSENVFSSINDSVCLENFEEIINKSTLEELSEFFRKMNIDSEDYGKSISFTVEICKLKNKENFLKFLNLLEKKKFVNSVFIYSINSNDLQENFELFNKIIDIYAKKKDDFKYKK